MKIITNNQSRPILCWYDLTEKEQEQLDTELEEGNFFRYKGEVYDLADFTLVKAFGWDGTLSETFFSGILIKFRDDGVIVCRYHS